MTHSPAQDVGLLPPAPRLSARRWENTAPHAPCVRSQRSRAGGNTRRILAALLGALTFTALLRDRMHHAPTPVMQHLTAADEWQFAVLCQQITWTRQGVEQ